jgi:transcriptional regulator with XRE-family HTH domain
VTLRELSQQTGIPLSTLSHVESGRKSLPFERLKQLAAGLGLTMSDFLRESAGPAPDPDRPRPLLARAAFARDADQKTPVSSKFAYHLLCANLMRKRMVPYLIRITRQASRKDLPEHLMRSGERFLFVIEGAVEVYPHNGMAVSLTDWNGAYLDSAIDRLCVVKDHDEVLLLAIRTQNGEF